MYYTINNIIIQNNAPTIWKIFTSYNTCMSSHDHQMHVSNVHLLYYCYGHNGRKYAIMNELNKLQEENLLPQ